MTTVAFARNPVYGLWHPGTQATVSGYGLAIQPGQPDWLVGLLMIDQPQPADPTWLAAVEATFGRYDLVAMTATGERGITCQMWIEPGSRGYIRRVKTLIEHDLVIVLRRFLEYPPNPRFRLSWDPNHAVWVSNFIDVERQAPPDIETLIQWLEEDGGCEATDGCWVETDGTCPHGYRSWLVELGLI